jgi:hypothetical protein
VGIQEVPGSRSPRRTRRRGESRLDKQPGINNMLWTLPAISSIQHISQVFTYPVGVRNVGLESGGNKGHDIRPSTTDSGSSTTRVRPRGVRTGSLGGSSNGPCRAAPPEARHSDGYKGKGLEVHAFAKRRSGFRPLPAD